MPFDNQNLFKPIEVTIDPWAMKSEKLWSIIPEVKEVIFAPPATIVYWNDGTRTVVKCSDDDYFNEEIGFALCFMKKILSTAGYKNNFNTYIRKNIKNAKRYWRPVSLTETPVVESSDVISTLADKIKEILMPQHGMDKGSL